MMERVARLMMKPHLCEFEGEKIVEGSFVEELAFFRNVVVPRLEESGFSQISAYMKELQVLITRNTRYQESADPNKIIDQIPLTTSAPPANTEWIHEFRKAWERASC